MIGIDGALVRRRRLEMGVPAVRLAGLCGVTAATVAGVENGQTGARVQLSTVQRLADVLALDPLDLLVDTDAVPPTNMRQCGPEDVRTLGALLHDRPRNVSVGDIASVTHWSVTRVRVTLDGLATALNGTGARLQRQNQRIRVVADEDSTIRAAATALDRVKTRQNGLGRTETKFIADALKKNLKIGAHSEDKRHIVGRLVNAGYLVEDGEGRYKPGPTVLDAVTPGGLPPATLVVPDHAPVKAPGWHGPTGPDLLDWHKGDQAVATRPHPQNGIVTDDDIIGQWLTAAADGPFFPDWEFRTLFGLERAEVASIAAAWPRLLPGADTDLAVNNSLANLTSYPHGRETQWSDFISVPPSELDPVFRRWRPKSRFGPAPHIL